MFLLPDKTKSCVIAIVALFLFSCRLSIAYAADYQELIDEDQLYSQETNNHAKNESRTLDEFKKIEQKIIRIINSRNPLKTIFVISLDNIILKPVDKEFFFSDQTLKGLQERALSAVRESKLMFSGEVIFTEYQHQIVDQRIIELINNVQKKGVPVIIINKNVSGKFNKISYLEQWTVALLKKYGIDLSLGQFAKIRLVMDKYSSKERGSYPTFFDGLLSCSSYEGKNAEQNVLTTLLVRFGFKPSTVVMLHYDNSVLGVMKEQLHQMKSDAEFFGFELTYDQEEYNAQDPEAFLSFWKSYAKKLNSVSRGPSDSDAGNPYEEE